MRNDAPHIYYITLKAEMQNKAYKEYRVSITEFTSFENFIMTYKKKKGEFLLIFLNAGPVFFI